MYRSLLIGTAILFLSINFIVADTYKAKIKAVDDEKRTVTFEVDGKDKTFDLVKDVKIYTTGKAKKGQAPPEILLTLAAIKDKDTIVTTDKVDAKEIVTMIKLDDAKKKKKKAE